MSTRQLKHEGMFKRDCAKDKKKKHSVFEMPVKAPYPLNVYDRDFLVQSLTLYKA